MHQRPTKTYLDQLRTRPQERRRVVDVLDDLHRTHDIEPLRFLHERLSRRMPERQRPRRRRRCCRASETWVRSCVARRDADVFRRCVDGERISAETSKTLIPA